jgi:hypothetical protein
MTKFRKYDHLERLGHRNVQGIDMGLVHVFPKLDGTNSSVWWDGDAMRCASRRRQITPDDDNAGFAAWVMSDDLVATALRDECAANPNWIIYGKWMVPHTLKTYREEVWRKFWIFDVYDRVEGTYVPYDHYSQVLEGLDIIEPLCTIQDPSEEQLKAQVETNTYLIAEGAGLGEGVVLKNYTWRTAGSPWAKVVRNVFKEEAARAFGHAQKHGEFQVEVAIAEEFVTAELVGKTRAKVVLDIANEVFNGIDGLENNWQQQIEAEHRNKVIPQLLGRVFHDLIDEEMWAILKKHKNATIDFKRLQGRVVLATKALAEDLF